MATGVTQGELDQILAIHHNYERSVALRNFFETHDQVKLKATEPTRFQIRGVAYECSPTRAILCSPRVAVQILTLYGRRGLYRNKDQATMLTKNKFDAMTDEQRKKYERRNLQFRTAVVYHDDADDSQVLYLDDDEAEPQDAPEASVEETVEDVVTEDQSDAVTVGETAEENERKKRRTKKG